MRRAAGVVVTPAERRLLETWAAGRTSPGRLAVRARIVLAAADGASNRQIAARLGVHLETVARWRARFLLTGIEGILREAPRAGAAGRVPPATVRRIVDASLRPRSPSGSRWTTRSLARSLRVNHMLVHRVWSAHGLGNRSAPAARPRVDLGGAFVTPGARALVFTVDDRPDPTGGSPLPELVPNPTGSPEFSGPAERSREVVRTIGAMEALAQTRSPGSDASLLVFLREVERTAARTNRLEVVFDRPLARLGRRVRRWLAAHARFKVFTPARPQRWSEAVDAWLRRWEAAGLDRGSLALAPELARRLPARAPDRRRGPRGPGFSWEPSTPAPLGPSWGLSPALVPDVRRPHP